MGWRRRVWTIVNLCTVALIVGCASQQKQTDSQFAVTDTPANDREVVPEPDSEELTTVSPLIETATAVPKLPAAMTSEATAQLAGAEAMATAAPSVTPTISATLTTEQDAANANADVLFVSAKQGSEDTWSFAVTVEHPDKGWEDYADGWDVLLPDGSVAKPDPGSPFTRLLLHPHETEQPFTRSQSGIFIPHEVNEVTVRAHDIVDGFGGREVTLDLLLDSGPDYEVQRSQN